MIPGWRPSLSPGPSRVSRHLVVPEPLLEPSAASRHPGRAPAPALRREPRPASLPRVPGPCSVHDGRGCQRHGKHASYCSRRADALRFGFAGSAGWRRRVIRSYGSTRKAACMRAHPDDRQITQPKRALALAACFPTMATWLSPSAGRAAGPSPPLAAWLLTTVRQVRLFIVTPQ